MHRHGSSGLAGRLASETRLIAPLGACVVCLLAPGNPAGAAVAAITVGCWLLACRPRLRLVARGTLIGLAFFLPYLLAVPLATLGRPAPPGKAGSGLAVGVSILCRGMGLVWLSVATSATMSESDVRLALAGLHVPDGPSLLVQQILHQSGLLVRETRQIAAAMAVRGGTGSGRLSWLVLSSFPRVWLPRVAARAGRVAAAMELRGYVEHATASGDARPAGGLDVVTIVVAFVAVAATAALRWGVTR